MTWNSVGQEDNQSHAAGFLELVKHHIPKKIGLHFLQSPCFFALQNSLFETPPTKRNQIEMNDIKRYSRLRF